jgi:hypothetical protein
VVSPSRQCSPSRAYPHRVTDLALFDCWCGKRISTLNRIHSILPSLLSDVSFAWLIRESMIQKRPVPSSELPSSASALLASRSVQL